MGDVIKMKCPACKGKGEVPYFDSGFVQYMVKPCPKCQTSTEQQGVREVRR